MHTLHRRILLKTYQLFDLVIMVGWFVISVAVEVYLTTHISFNDFVGMRIKIQNFVLFIGFLFAWHLIFRAFSLYQTRRLSHLLNHPTTQQRNHLTKIPSSLIA
jgi:membrane protein CcdC involved in cytochrome C biogenesis